jgi:hypothetical protein
MLTKMHISIVRIFVVSISATIVIVHVTPTTIIGFLDALLL